MRYLINPLMTWVVTHEELEVLAPEVVQGLVADVFQNPEKGECLLTYTFCLGGWSRRGCAGPGRRRVPGPSDRQARWLLWPAAVARCCLLWRNTGVWKQEQHWQGPSAPLDPC